MKSRERWVGKAKIAAILGVGIRQIDNYAAEGMPRRKRGRTWQYEEGQCATWKKGRRRTRSEEQVAFERARTRRELAQAQMMEDELALRRGELYTGTEVDHWVAILADTLRANVMALPRHAHRVEATRTFQDAHVLLEDIARELLVDLQSAIERVNHGNGSRRGGRPPGPAAASKSRTHQPARSGSKTGRKRMG